MEPRILYEEHPSMFRNQPVWFVVCVLLSLVGVGLLILGWWWLETQATKLTITTERTILRRGLLSKSLTEVWHADVRNVQLNQSFFQRMFDVGRLSISSAGQSGVELDVAGMPDPDGAKELIDEQKRLTVAAS